MNKESELRPLEVEVVDNDVVRAYRKLKRMLENEGVQDDLRKRDERRR